MGSPLDIVKELPGYKKWRFAYLLGVAIVLFVGWLISHVEDVQKAISAVGSDLEFKVTKPEIVLNYAKKKYGITPIDMDATPPVFSPYGAEFSVSVLNKGKNILPLNDIKVMDSKSGKEIVGFSIHPNIRSNVTVLEPGKTNKFVLSTFSLHQDAADAIFGDSFAIVVEAGHEKRSLPVIGYSSEQFFNREVFDKSRTLVPLEILNAMKKQENIIYIDKESKSHK